ncbi:MAG: tetratricopeptide repeat protein [Thermodesulfobacteriota bacterium]
MNKIEEIFNSKYFAVALIIAVSVLVYFNTLSAEFVYDDNHQVIKNKWIHSLSNIPAIFTSSAWGFSKDMPSSNYYRPVMHLSYLFSAKLFGIKPLGFHLVNVLLHTLNAVMVFVTASSFSGELVPKLKKEGKATVFCLAAALLFAVHPINSEVVAWVAGVPELSFTLFVLVSFNLYIRRGGDSIVSAYFILSLLFFFLATLSKETALMLPIIIIAYDYLVRRDISLRTPAVLLRRYIPFFGVSVVYFILRFNALAGIAPRAPQHTELSGFQNIINIFPLVGKYFLKLVLPTGLNAYHMLRPALSLADPRFIISLIFTIALLFAIWQLRRTRPAVSFLLIWIIVPLLPVLYIPVLGENTFTERYLYLPTVGFTIFICTIFFLAKERLNLKSTVPVLIIVAILTATGAAASVARIKVWHDDLVLWTETLKKSPNSALVRYSMGYAFYQRDRLPEAIVEYKKALDINYSDRSYHYDIGLAYQENRNMNKAIFHYREAIRFGFAKDADTRINLGNSYAMKGMPGKAVAEYKAVLAFEPGNLLAKRNMGIVMKKLGNQNPK